MSILASKAIYRDGQTSATYYAVLSISESHLEFYIDNVESKNVRVFKIEFLDIENISDHEMYIYLNREMGERLEITDAVAVQFIRKNRKSPYFSLTENNREKIFVGLAILIAIVAVFWIVAPFVSRVIAQSIPVEYELKIQSYSEDALKGEICADSEQHLLLQSVAEKLMAYSGVEFPVKVFLGRDGPVVNAFAYPGGVIVVTPAIIKKMKSPDVLAGVMAHELQHHIQRHILTHMIRGTLMTAIWTAAFGDFSGFFILDPSTVAQIATLKFNRDDEASADREGLKMLQNSRIPVEPTLDFLDELSKMSGGSFLPEFISSHPLEKRGERYRGQFQVSGAYTPILSNNDWKRLSAGCKKDKQ